MIYKAVPINKEHSAKPGAILKSDKNGIEVACGKGSLLLTELQAAGKKRLSAAEFIRGVPFTKNTVLG